ncbi:hypothetical protein [Amycolatopsis sp. NPDC051061]|uniref:hypothetical protein n=1 Tax=Amycolatopsis sp. NPDC051061 TaxID=3155042 RepID=UPI00341BC482
MRGKHRDAAAYELGVLDDPEEFETHLDGCPRCRDLLTGLGPVTAALEEAARLGYLPGGGSPRGGPPVSGGSAGAGSPALGGSADHGSPASGGLAGAGLPVSGGSAGAGSPAFGGSAGAGSPTSAGAAEHGSPTLGRPPVSGSTADAGGSYPPPSDGAARRRKPCVFSDRRGPVIGALLLGVAVTVVCAARPASARTWFASAASIVSPAQVVAGTGHDLRDLPWSAGFQ